MAAKSSVWVQILTCCAAGPFGPWAPHSMCAPKPTFSIFFFTASVMQSLATLKQSPLISFITWSQHVSCSLLHKLYNVKYYTILKHSVYSNCDLPKHNILPLHMDGLKTRERMSLIRFYAVTNSVFSEVKPRTEAVTLLVVDSHVWQASLHVKTWAWRRGAPLMHWLPVPGFWTSAGEEIKTCSKFSETYHTADRLQSCHHHRVKAENNKINRETACMVMQS